ncbi:hypothetical protein [Variovorax sp. dw_308]|uniref:hypothetical protein n=1 Tax=Variovorax sp. dw_308 TaxID=2721546 RepID=UPI003529C0F5
MLVHIKAIHAETRGGYDWPRIWKILLACGIRVGKDRAQRRVLEAHQLPLCHRSRNHLKTRQRHAGTGPMNR